MGLSLRADMTPTQTQSAVISAIRLLAVERRASRLQADEPPADAWLAT